MASIASSPALAAKTAAAAPRSGKRRVSQRFVMLVSPEERAEWGERAEKAGWTTADFMRRAAQSFDPEEAAAMAEIEAILPEAEKAIADIRRTFAEMHEILDYALDPARDEEARQKAAASITDDEIEAMASLLA